MSVKKGHKKKKNQVKLILNPLAGDPEDANARLEGVTRLMQEHGFEVDVALAKPKEAAEAIARKARKKGYRMVVVMGGDGTIEAAARALIGSKVRLGLLPGGTENNVIKALGIPDDLTEAVQILKEGHPKKIDVGQARIRKGKKRYFLELTAIGLAAELFPAGKLVQQGSLIGVEEVAREFLSYQMPKMRVKIDGEAMEIESMLALVMNTPSFGTGFRTAPDARLDDGCLDVCVYPKMNKAQIATYFASISDQKESEEIHIKTYHAKRVTISAHPKQKIVTDSISLGKGKVKIKAVRGALRVMVGRV